MEKKKKCATCFFYLFKTSSCSQFDCKGEQRQHTTWTSSAKKKEKKKEKCTIEWVERRERERERIVGKSNFDVCFLCSLEKFIRRHWIEKKENCQQGEWKENHIMFVAFSFAQSDSIFGSPFFVPLVQINEKHPKKISKKLHCLVYIFIRKYTFTAVFIYKIWIDITWRTFLIP